MVAFIAVVKLGTLGRVYECSGLLHPFRKHKGDV